MNSKTIKHSFPFYVREYLADTSRFNCHQHGMYLLLLLEYWSLDGQLIDDDDELCDITKLDRKTFDKNISAVKNKFGSDGEYLSHDGLDAELTKLKNIQKKRREGGRLGAQKRWGTKLATE